MATTNLDYTTFSSDHRNYRSVFIAGLTILIYDHLLTLPSEAKHIWSSRLRPSTCWFLVVRYSGLGASLVITVFYFGELSHKSCIRMQIAWEGLLCLQEVLVEFTLGLRVFALYGLNPWILLSLVCAGGTSAALATWSIVTYGRPKMLSAPGLPGCHTAIPRDSALRLAGAWEAQLVCDVLVFSLTLYRAYVQKRSFTGFSSSLIQRMVQDGAMYFGIIVVANLANLFTFYLGDILLAGFLSWFTTSLSMTLICRLMLNLHQAADVGMDTAVPNEIDLETIEFSNQPTANEDNFREAQVNYAVYAEPYLGKLDIATR